MIVDNSISSVRQGVAGAYQERVRTLQDLYVLTLDAPRIDLDVALMCRLRRLFVEVGAVNSVRMYSLDENNEPSAQSTWHGPSHPSPRWGLLYAMLGVISVLGLIGHMKIHDPTGIVLLDAVFGALLFAALIGWVHSNRIALRTVDGSSGVERPLVTVIKPHTSHAHATDRIIRLDPEDRSVLPYDIQ
jgi:hypothetical protein